MGRKFSPHILLQCSFVKYKAIIFFLFIYDLIKKITIFANVKN